MGVRERWQVVPSSYALDTCTCRAHYMHALTHLHIHTCALHTHHTCTLMHHAHMYTHALCARASCVHLYHTHYLCVRTMRTHTRVCMHTSVEHVHCPHTCTCTHHLCVSCARMVTHMRIIHVCVHHHMLVYRHTHLFALPCIRTCELPLASLSVDFLHASHLCLKRLFLSPPSHPTHLCPMEQNAHPLLSGIDPLFSRGHTFADHMKHGHRLDSAAMSPSWAELSPCLALCWPAWSCPECLTSGLLCSFLVSSSWGRKNAPLGPGACFFAFRPLLWLGLWVPKAASGWPTTLRLLLSSRNNQLLAELQSWAAPRAPALPMSCVGGHRGTPSCPTSASPSTCFLLSYRTASASSSHPELQIFAWPLPWGPRACMVEAQAFCVIQPLCPSAGTSPTRSHGGKGVHDPG